MRIRQITVKGLFGFLDHKIPLKQDEHITIIHGPNGFGKTFVLRMAAGLLTGRYSVFTKVPFQEFSIDFDDETTLSITSSNQTTPPTKKASARDHGPEFSITLTKNHRQIHRTSTASNPRLTPSGRERLSQALEAYTPLSRVGLEEWRDPETHEIISLDEAIERFGSILPRSSGELLRQGINENEWLEGIRTNTPVRFIQTQRLDTFTAEGIRRESSREPTPTVKKYSDELTREIQLVLGKYAKQASKLDSTFPERLFNLEQSEPLQASELRTKLVELEQKRAKLNELGLLDPGQGLRHPPEHALERNRDVLSVYVGDVEKKLSVFDETENKIGLLTRVINSRFKYKKLTISRDRGFAFTSDNGSELDPADLSSGEQHQLVLLYELLFKTRPNSLVLIDEPEISLHIVWQEQFLTDLHEMAALSGFDAIVATHSPQLIGEHWDWTVGLNDPKNVNPPQQQK